MKFINEKFCHFISEEEIDTDDEYAIVYNILNGKIIFNIPDIKSLTNATKNTLAKNISTIYGLILQKQCMVLI